jgi:hypothetical protein
MKAKCIACGQTEPIGRIAIKFKKSKFWCANTGTQAEIKVIDEPSLVERE